MTAVELASIIGAGVAGSGAVIAYIFKHRRNGNGNGKGQTELVSAAITAVVEAAKDQTKYLEKIYSTLTETQGDIKTVSSILKETRSDIKKMADTVVETRGETRAVSLEQAHTQKSVEAIHSRFDTLIAALHGRDQ